MTRSRSFCATRCALGAFLATLAGAMLGCSEAPTGSGLETAEQSIAGGELDRTHPEVFELITHFAGGSVGSCTATLIAPNLLVTARHCLAATAEERVTCGEAPFGVAVPGSSVVVTNATQPDQSSRFFRGRSVSVPEQGNDTCGFDLALLVLGENVPASVASPAVPRIDRAAELGEPYVAVGYGRDAQGNPTQGRMSLGGLAVQCEAACGRFGVAPSEFLGDSGVCSGDSGGPAIDAEGKVIGVLSRGSEPCGTPVYGAPAAFADWMMASARAAASSGGYEPPFWAETGSSDRPPGAVGDPCSADVRCADELVCYYEADPADARCTRTCAVTPDCSLDERCELGFDVAGGGLCLTPETEGIPRDPPGDGCALHPPQSHDPKTPVGVLTLFALALGLAARRVHRAARAVG